MDTSPQNPVNTDVIGSSENNHHDHDITPSFIQENINEVSLKGTDASIDKSAEDIESDGIQNLTINDEKENVATDQLDTGNDSIENNGNDENTSEIKREETEENTGEIISKQIEDHLQETAGVTIGSANSNHKMADDQGEEEEEDIKLDLSDNIDHDDFSKLLEFDAKNDDDLFANSDIYEESIKPSDHHDIEHIRKSIDQDLELNHVNSEELPERSSVETKENTERDEPVVEENKHQSDNASSPTPEAVREEIALPSTQNSDTNKSEREATTNDLPILNESINEIHTDNGNNLRKDSIIQNTMKLEDSSASATIEKNGVLTKQRQNSLTPGMFRPNEVTVQEPVTSESNTSGANGNLNTQQTVDENVIPEEQPTIFAYARLDFQSFTFYVQTLHAIIGRRSENDFSHKVDVNLGPSKSISRRHAQIFYNFGTGRFELSIIGKNGAFVDDIFVERGNTVPLRNRTKIQIGQIPFQFVLPEQDKNQFNDKSVEPLDISEPDEIKPVKKKETKSKASEPPKKKPTKAAAKKEKKPAKQPKKVYTLEEIPEQYRVKPTISYSAMLTACIRKYSKAKGMSLSEIYAGIRELFPFYKYCPDGWQSSVRHNLSLNKSFRKVSKEGKGWLWGLDEEYIATREKQKKIQAEAAAAKAQAAQLRLEQQNQQKAKQLDAARKTNSVMKVGGEKKQTISQTLAANRSASNKKNSVNDHQRTMKYLQEQLIILTKDRKGLSKQVIANILTQALAMTINQVTQAAKSKGIKGNPLTALMDKNPQHLNLILAAAVNAATAKVTNGKVKQLVSNTNTVPPKVPVQASKSNTSPTKPVKKPDIPLKTEANNSTTDDKPTQATSFDPTSLSRFFQPKQQAQVQTQNQQLSSQARSTNISPSPSTIPQKRSREEESDSSETEDSSSDSDSDDDDDDTSSSSDDDDDEDEDDDDDNKKKKSSGSDDSSDDSDSSDEGSDTSDSSDDDKSKDSRNDEKDKATTTDNKEQ